MHCIVLYVAVEPREIVAAARGTELMRTDEKKEGIRSCSHGGQMLG